MKPSKLHSGDLVAIISPSQPPTTKHSHDDFEKARKNFEQATGLKTVLAPNALAEHFYSAGTIQQRLDDFHWALKNPEVKGIMFSVGGNTAIELVDKLDYALIKQHPKIIAGISDATTLLNPIFTKTGLITFLGPEFTDFALEPMTYEVASIKQAWFDGKMGEIQSNPNWRDFDGLSTSYKGWTTIRPGVAEGYIIGGNYSGFTQLYHTEYAPNITGSLLVMECYKYSKRDIHSALARLKFWGAFDKINGLIIGYCLGSDEPGAKGNDRSMAELALEVTEGYDFPIMQIGEIGHNVENMMLPIGARAKLDATAEKFEILEKVVMASRIVIVNAQDEIIGHKERGTLVSEDIYRVAGLWVTNTGGDILLAQRQLGKRHDPGKWGPAVAGTVDEGETYESNIIKEAEEEINLKAIKPVKSKMRRYTGEHNYFCQWYTLVVDKSAKDFTIQEEEVAQVKWFTRAELEQELRAHPENYLKGLDWAVETLS